MEAIEQVTGTTLIELLRGQADLTPDRLAVADEHRRWTYAELHAAADSVARRLVADGVVPGDAVGVYLPRSAEAVAAILGVIFTGAAYVPLDVNYPEARLRYMCETAGVSRLAVGPTVAVSFDHRARMVDVSSSPDPGAGRPTPETDPRSAAYVLFTSGSTGILKGVRVAHEGVVSLLRWAHQAFSADELSLVAGTTSFSFDPSVLEIFTPLTTGGALHVLPNALALADLDPSIEVRSALLPPSALQELVHSGRLPSSLRTVMTGGESLRAGLANRILARTSIERLIFAYGPTETTVMATVHEVAYPAEDVIPIGRELPGIEIELLDEHGDPVPVGEMGEIYVSGPQVALGYVGGDPEARAQFGSTAGPAAGRRYRTLDRARRRPDGTLEFGGRVDRQVKVRGFRVEPGEVEAVLSRHPGVAQAFVRAVGPSGATQLVGYTVPLDGPVPPAELRTFLRAALPAYMVPSTFVSLDAFPVNGSGKVDAEALPLPGPRLEDLRSEAGAADDLERAMKDLVREVLDVSHEVDLTDDFMDDLGGSSLSAFRLLFEIEERFGVAIPMTALLEDATIGGFVRAVRATAIVPTHQLLHNVESRQVPLVLVHAWLSNVMRYRRIIPHLDAGRPLIGIHVHDRNPDVAGTSSLPAMARRAIEQLRSVRPEGPYVLGGHSTGGLIAYEMAQELRAAGETVALVILIDTPVPQSGWRFWYDEAKWNLADFRTFSMGDVTGRLRSFVGNRAMGSRPAVRATQRAEDTVARINRTNYLAVKDYRPVPYPGDVLVLRTEQGTRMAHGDPVLGWDRLVSGLLSSAETEGTHDGMLDEPHVGRLTEHLNKALSTLP